MASARGDWGSLVITKAVQIPLPELFSLNSCSACDMLFVAIDFEGTSNFNGDLFQNLNSEVGIAVLDMKKFDSTPPNEIISSYSFASGSASYQGKADVKFKFGRSNPITQDQMLECIKSCIPNDRQVVLVGHDIIHECRILQILNFDFAAHSISILDTQKLAPNILQAKKLHMSLKKLLARLQCRTTGFHNGGNDANYTMRVLLLLAVKACIQDGGGIDSKLVKMEEIARCPFPNERKTVLSTKVSRPKLSRPKLSRPLFSQPDLWSSIARQEATEATREAKREAREAKKEARKEVREVEKKRVLQLYITNPTAELSAKEKVLLNEARRGTRTKEQKQKPLSKAAKKAAKRREEKMKAVDPRPMPRKSGSIGRRILKWLGPGFLRPKEDSPETSSQPQNNADPTPNYPYLLHLELTRQSILTS